MQPVTVQEQTEYATLGWRFAAVLVDTVVLFGLLILIALVYIVVLAGQGRVDLNDPAAVQALGSDLKISDLTANLIVFGGLFIYYAVLEAIFSASIGKLVFRMRVTMLDGSRPSGTAVLVRNLVRIPEAWLLYVPAGVSCLASPRRQRLGDHAARTVVVRRRSVAAGVSGSAATSPGGPQGYAPPAQPAPAEPPAPLAPAGWPVAPAVAPAPATPSLSEALSRLKTAALALRGAHFNYLRFSELELAGATTSEDAGYSEEYVSAWFTLADAVAGLGEARREATSAASGAGMTLDEAGAVQPDLAHLMRELAPYLDASTDEQIHDAYLAVARREASPS